MKTFQGRTLQLILPHCTYKFHNIDAQYQCYNFFTIAQRQNKLDLFKSQWSIKVQNFAVPYSKGRLQETRPNKASQGQTPQLTLPQYHCYRKSGFITLAQGVYVIYYILLSIVHSFIKKIMMKYCLHSLLGRYLRMGLRLTG